MKTDVYQIVTDKIIQRLEQGVLPWKHYYDVTGRGMRSEELSLNTAME